MKPIVKITVENGSMKGKEFAFDKPIECLVGRSEDCDIKVPDSYENMDVSRHHCLFHINPPSIGVSDLISRNGTFVNNREIESLSARESIELNDDDKVRLGHLVMQVHIDEQETEDVLASAYADVEWVGKTD